MDHKQKELLTVVASVVTRCLSSLANHTNNAIQAGATKQEIQEAAAIGVVFGCGPAFVMVRDNLLNILDQLEVETWFRPRQKNPGELNLSICPWLKNIPDRQHLARCPGSSAVDGKKEERGYLCPMAMIFLA